MPSEPDAPVYRINEGTLPLDVPGVWEDQTLHVLRLPGDGQASTSLVITRETLPVGVEVDAYVHAEVDRLREALPEFALMGTAPVAWADAPGEAVLTRWRAKDGLMDQITACRKVEGRRVLIFTATHPSPMAGPTYQALLGAIAGFRPHEPPAEAAPAAPAGGAAANEG